MFSTRSPPTNTLPFPLPVPPSFHHLTLTSPLFFLSSSHSTLSPHPSHLSPPPLSPPASLALYISHTPCFFTPHLLIPRSFNFHPLALVFLFTLLLLCLRSLPFQSLRLNTQLFEKSPIEAPERIPIDKEKKPLQAL